MFESEGSVVHREGANILFLRSLGHGVCSLEDEADLCSHTELLLQRCEIRQDTMATRKAQHNGKRKSKGKTHVEDESAKVAQLSGLGLNVEHCEEDSSGNVEERCVGQSRLRQLRHIAEDLRRGGDDPFHLSASSCLILELAQSSLTTAAAHRENHSKPFCWQLCARKIISSVSVSLLPWAAREFMRATKAPVLEYHQQFFCLLWSITGIPYSLGFSLDHPPWILPLSATAIEYQ